MCAAQVVDEAALQRHLTNLQKAINDDADDQILKNSELALAIKQDEDIVFCKIVALAKIGKYQQAQQLLTSLKRNDESVKFIKGYLAYRLGHYQEAMDAADSAMNDLKMTLLKAQVLSKRENYEASCNILATLLIENSQDSQPIYEELCANYFNSLALYVWNLVSVDLECNISQRRLSLLLKK